MIQKSIYLTNPVTLQQKDYTLRLIFPDNTVKDVPIETVHEIFCFSQIQTNSHFYSFLSKHGILMHYFDYYGNYTGSFYPKEQLISGATLVKQVEFYSNQTKRMKIAQEFLLAGSSNMLRNLKYYARRGADITACLSSMTELKLKIPCSTTIPELMGIEGNIRNNYYQAWSEILPEGTDFTHRVYNPPNNMVNSLISFINALVYATTLREVYKTQLNPAISYLHEPGSRRFSLCLDISEVFKPLLSDRLLFSLLNKKQITLDSFESFEGGCFLKEQARRTIVKAYDEKIQTTIKHRSLNHSVSYAHLIRLECYKLIKHLYDEKAYKGFEIWW